MFFSLNLGSLADTPLQVIRDSNEAILSLYQNRDSHSTTFIEREAEVIMDEVTSFKTLAQMVMVEFPETVSSLQREKFTRIFSRLLKLNAIKKLGRYRASHFEYLDEKIDGDEALVNTIALFDDDAIPIDYVLKKINGHYQIVNYVVWDVDTVINYRKQFKRLLMKESFETLLLRLQSKIKKLEETE